MSSIGQEEIEDVLLNYHIGFAFYSNVNLNNYYFAPNKIFQYLNSRIAIITNDYPGLLDIIEKNNIGVCINEISTQSLRNAIMHIYEKKLYLNITDMLRKKYSRETQKKRIYKDHYVI